MTKKITMMSAMLLLLLATAFPAFAAHYTTPTVILFIPPPDGGPTRLTLVCDDTTSPIRSQSCGHSDPGGPPAGYTCDIPVVLQQGSNLYNGFQCRTPDAADSNGVANSEGNGGGGSGGNSEGNSDGGSGGVGFQIGGAQNESGEITTDNDYSVSS